jgi:hypothetical protein
MPFTPPRLSFALEPASPTILTPANLKTQLNAIGFRCPLTEEPVVAKYIQDGLAAIPNGGSCLIAILSSKASVEARAAALSRVEGTAIRSVNDIAFADSPISFKSVDGTVKDYYLERVNGSFSLHDPAALPAALKENALKESALSGDNVSKWVLSYLMFEKLCTIAQDANFNKLTTENYNGFTAHSKYETRVNMIDDTDENTIKQLLAALVAELASRVLYDFKKTDILPILVNRLGNINTTAEDFRISDDIITVWANNPQGNQVDALGVINSKWEINGQNRPGSDDKKNQRSAIHETEIAVTTRSVIYTDEEIIKADYNHVTGKD